MSEHWLQHAHGRIVAGDSEPEVMADYGWVQRMTEAEHDALEFAVETGRVATHDQAILRSLLERLK